MVKKHAFVGSQHLIRTLNNEITFSNKHGGFDEYFF